MRNKKSLLYFFTTLIIVILTFVFVSSFVIKPKNLQRIYNYVNDFINSDSEIDISFSEVNRNFINHIEIKDLNIKCKGDLVFSSSDVYVSSGVGDMFKSIFRDEDLNFNLTMDNAVFHFNQKFYDYLKSKSNDSKSFSDLIRRISANVIVNNFSFDADYNGNVIKTSDNISLEAVIKQNLTLNTIKCNIPQSYGFIDSLNSDYCISDISLSSDVYHNIKINIGSIAVSEMMDVSDIISNFSFRDGLISGKGILNSADFSLDSVNGNLKGIEFSYDLNINAGNKSFLFTSDVVSGSACYNGYEISFEKMTSSGSLFPENHEKHLFLSSDKTSVFNLSEFKIDNLEFNNLFLSWNNSELNDNDFELQAFVNGKSTLEDLDDFSGQVSLDTEFFGFDNIFSVENYSNLNLEIIGFNLTDLYNNHLNLFMSDSDHIDVSANLNNELNLYSSFNLSDKTANVRTFFNEFAIEKYFSLLKKYIPLKFTRYYDEQTSLNGSVIYNGSMDLEDISGRLSLNLVGNNLLFGSNHRTLAASVEAEASGNNANIDSLAITGFGKRLSYSGTVNLDSLFPQGTLLLQNSFSGKELGFVDFTLDNDRYGYVLSGHIADKPDFELLGRVNWDDNFNIQTSIDVKTENGNYDFSADYDHSLNTVDMCSGDSFAQFVFKDSELKSEITLDDFSLFFNNNVELRSDAYLNGIINIEDKKFNLNCDNFRLFVSDILSFGFSFDISQNIFNLSSLNITSNGVDTYYDGKAHFEYNSVSDIFKGVSDSFFCDVNLLKRNSDDYIRAYSSHNDYSFSMINNGNHNYYVNLLGNRGNGFFADCNFEDLYFEACCKNKKLEFYNGNGKFGLFNIDDIFVNIDFIEKTLKARTVLKTVRHHLDKDVEQGGIIMLDAKLQSLVLGALSMAGIDVDAKFNLQLKDCYLGNELSFKDTDIDLTLSRNNLYFDGELINGTFNIATNYLDIDVNPSFLLGFHANGYFDDNLDIFVSDIYIPAKLLDQFIATPIVSSKDGVIEGSVLINGSSDDPSMYGSLFVQSFNMELFYLPEQTLSVRNMILNFHDHSVSADFVPVIGNSTKDGRFYKANMDIDLDFNSLSVDTLNLSLDIYENSIDLWIPIKSKTPVNIRGDANGKINVWYRNNELGIDGSITASNADVSFTLSEYPEWFEYMNLFCSANLEIIMGNNVVFYYPSKNYPFMNFTIQDGEKMFFSHSMITKKNSGEGNLAIKTGRISYIQNDFTVTDGQLRLTKPVLNQDGLDFSIDLTAKLREYDTNGQRVDILLILKDAQFTNINPRFESIPFLTEKEILSILGQSILPGEDQNLSFSGIANAAAIATDAIASLGIIDTNEKYSINSVIKDSLNLDVLSFRSPLVQNIIINAIPGYDTSSNLLAKYLNGTTLYAGKYVSDSIFAKMTLLLKDSGHKGRNLHYGHFLTDDLNLDIEFSFDWDNPIGNFSLFMQPHELSVLNFLDTIGFSYTKRFKF